MSNQSVEQVSQFWDQHSKNENYGFWKIPGWDEHQNILASNNPSQSWLDVLKNDLLKENIKAGHGLSLGCGEGSFERSLIEKEICKTVEGCDISTYRLELANQHAIENDLDINYFFADLNAPNFTKDKYDTILAAGILHHIENLELLFENLKSALNENGKLLVYDYVGPTRFQWTESQIAYCNEILDSLPEKFKTKCGYPWYYHIAKNIFDLFPFSDSKNIESFIQKYFPSTLYHQFLRLKYAQLKLRTIRPPHPNQFLVTDPSEAIRSSEIIPLLKEHFTIKKIHSLGGTLAQPIFMRTTPNFLKYSDGQKYAKEILVKERSLIHENKISSDFVAFIAYPKK